tara:strand:+ start:193 stop:615 length:423 start_codon:yes stop_codon:yes gene_type:complete
MRVFDMDLYIDNSDDFEGLELFEYTFKFEGINDEQIEQIIYYFKDWDWEQGLHISELNVDKNNNITSFIFKSGKYFEFKDEEKWTEEDLDKNLLTRLIGKEQFIPLFQDLEIDSSKIKFLDNDKTEYAVEVSKYSSLIKK